MDPTQMNPAGGEKYATNQSGRGVSDILNQGQINVPPKNGRDALSTHDINGGIKRNSYGAVVTVEERLKNEIAG